MEEHTVVAVDVAKAVFELAVSEEPGRVKLHRRLSRGELELFFAQTRKATVVIEACGSAHHWGRQLQGLGHTVVPSAQLASVPTSLEQDGPRDAGDPGGLPQLRICDRCP